MTASGARYCFTAELHLVEILENGRDKQATIVEADQKQAQEIQRRIHASNVSEHIHEVVDLAIVDIILPVIAEVRTHDVAVLLIILVFVVVDILNLNEVYVRLLTELHIVVLERSLR